ncbi:carboxy terminal-processing peptidase [Fulvivirga ulvae]|uniref:carboxy terminal-processing peptidase n=1 Tax=Fulvivirga ulvae TaxID=2904245 RepID=UPI001F2D2829|nr:carboxy terminal-processing peptidase [Fulvivirga ulvae]UII31700.1 carboxy terminal-processing peptidase [Fulvivirga ulvae]
MNRLLVALLLCFFSVGTYGLQNCELPARLVETLQANHYNPKELNDSLSSSIYEHFIRLLDPDAIVFSYGDIQKLNRLKDQIDDDVRTKECFVYEEVLSAYKAKLSKIIDHIKLCKLSDLSKYDTYEFTIPAKKEFPEDAIEIVNLQLKAGYFHRIQSKTASTDDSDFFNEAKEQVLCKYTRMLSPEEGLDQKVLSAYLNAIALAFDPHSQYMTEHDREQIAFALDTEAQGFGFTVSRNLVHELEVNTVIPGSPAWQDESIHEGDILLAVKADEVHLDLECMDVEEVNMILLQSPYETIKLRLKQSDQIKNIELRRSRLNQYGNTLKAFIVNGQKRFAYISIPSFYTSFDDPRYIKGLADDLAKELLNLKSENIDGLILDVRSNGGGSMAEAIKLLGLFIDEGVLFTIENSKKEVSTIKDPNRGVAYDGPLLVMINEASASASEVFAATIQDWGRGIIAGSKSYGKSTSQLILPVAHSKGHYLKVTTEAMHRITGSSYQGRGVIPDITLENILENFVHGESATPNYLRLSGHSAVVVNKSFLPINQLKEKSSARLSQTNQYASIKKMNNDLKKGKTFTIHMNKGTYESDMESLQTWFTQLEGITGLQHQQFELEIPEYSEFDISIDEVLSTDYKKAQETLKQDFYLWESYNILADYIEITN